MSFSTSSIFCNISIHAPAKGATITHACHLLERIYFNPRSREGSDSIYKVLQFFHSNFNPRSREGSDNSKHPAIHQNKIFQSTLPRRERPDTLEAVFRPVYISIHAPAKGATMIIRYSFRWELLFQSTLPRRERQSTRSSK